jgi:hypothetical protein
MAFKKILERADFWKSVIWMGLSFIIIYHIIAMLFEYGGFDFSAWSADKLEDGKWVRFILGTLVSGFLYGFIISFGKFRSKLKKENENL